MSSKALIRVPDNNANSSHSPPLHQVTLVALRSANIRQTEENSPTEDFFYPQAPNRKAENYQGGPRVRTGHNPISNPEEVTFILLHCSRIDHLSCSLWLLVQVGPALVIVAVWAVDQCMKDLSLSLLLSVTLLFKQKVNILKI